MLQVLSLKEARQRGYKPLAGPYDLASPDPKVRRLETRMWARVCQDLCTVDAVGVEVDTGRMEAWRHKDELIELTPETDE